MKNKELDKQELLPLQAKMDSLGEKIRNKARLEKQEKHLAPIKYVQKDFFIADLLDTSAFKDDVLTMEHPLFALKAGDTKEREYHHGNTFIVVAPHPKFGMATIYDKDIWIYCISKLVQALNENKPVNRTVRFTIYDYLVTTNRTTSGRDYERTKDALDRLRSTNIATNLETDEIREARGFGLVDSWHIVEEKEGRMIRIEVTLPEWLYRSVLAKQVLTISPDYFRLRKPLDRRIYELARKHCGNQLEWKISLDLLLKKSGSTTTLKAFRQAIKSLVEHDELPDYHVFYDTNSDMVIFKKI